MRFAPEIAASRLRHAANSRPRRRNGISRWERWRWTRSRAREATTVTSSKRSVGCGCRRVALGRCFFSHARSPFLSAAIGSQRPTTAPTESRISAMRATSDTRNGSTTTVPPNCVGPPDGVLDVVHPHIGCPMRRHPVFEKSLSELVDGADVVIRQAQTREAAAIRQLLVRRPAEQIPIKCLCAVSVGRGEVEPAKLSGIRFAKVYHGEQLSLSCSAESAARRNAGGTARSGCLRRQGIDEQFAPR